MTKTELLNLVNNNLAIGFEKYEFRPNASFYTKDKFSVESIERFNTFTNSTYTDHQYYGYAISANIVDKHNGAEDDISVDICIFKHEGTIARRINKVRVNTKQSIKTIEKRINEQIEYYKGL